MARKTVATIDLSALIDNFMQIKALAPESHSLAVIKANAYGHGAFKVARALDDVTDVFAVAFIDEAKMLREQGIDKTIVSLQGAYDPEESEWAGKNNVWLVVHSEQQLQWIDNLPYERPVIWPKVDTGMHRLGFQPSEITDILEKYAHLLSPESVIFTHLASADQPDNNKTLEQLACLQTNSVLSGFEFSVANSAGVINWQAARQKWNRIGIGMYGGATGPEQHSLVLKPVMSLNAKVIAIRDVDQGKTVGYGGIWQAKKKSRLATVAIGYADGYPRHAPNGTPAWCNGEPIFLAGRVSMDMLIFDVSHLPTINIGDNVELWGANLSVTEVAEHVGTIDYELMTRVSSRVPRSYI